MPSCCSCDVISTEVDGDDVVVRWRLAGRLNLPFKPPIKPYVVVTTFQRDAGRWCDLRLDELHVEFMRLQHLVVVHS